MRVIVSAENYNDGCAAYRSTGPWSSLARRYPTVDVRFIAKPDWAEIRMAHILYLSRPAEAELAKAVNAAKDFGTKIWVDWDDDVFEIPRDNRAKVRYLGLQEQVERFIRVADLVTVSTKHLQQKFSTWNKNVRVLPNALDDWLLKFKSMQDQQKIVLWRGTDTHTRDVATYSREIVEVSKRFPEYRFAFVGCDPAPWMTSELMPDPIIIDQPMTPRTYFETITILKPSIVMVPLADNNFNRSKSNIAALEGSLCGAAVLAPRWPEWTFDGVTQYSNQTEFREGLEALLSGSLNTGKLAQDTWNWVKSSMMLSQINGQRVLWAQELVDLPHSG